MRTDNFLEVMHELVAFVRVAETGSFSGAARQQGVAPSAISRQVARLGKTMGVSLLQRTTRQLRLTDAGLEVLAHGRTMIAAAQATLQVAEGHVGEPQGLVRVSAPKAFARHMLQPLLLDFLQPPAHFFQCIHITFTFRRKHIQFRNHSILVYDARTKADGIHTAGQIHQSHRFG